MRGSLKEVPVTDIFQLLHIGKKTGKLSLTNGSDFLEIFFKDGLVIYASMVNRKEKIGEMLLKDRIIDRDTLNRAIEHVEKGYPGLGFAFLDMGLDEEILRKYKEKEIIEYLQEALLWKEGFFNFNPDEFPKQKPLVKINPTRFLIESVTKYDEWERVKEIIFPLDIVLTKNYLFDESILNEREKRVYSLIDGEREIKEIIESSGIPLIEAAEIIQSLISRGIVRKHTSPKPSLHYEREKINEHLNLGFAFLKINLYEEAEREFRRVTELSPDTYEGYFSLGVLYIYRGEYETALKFFEKALQFAPQDKRVLHNLAFVHYKIGKIEEAERYIEKIYEMKKQGKKERLLKAIIDYKKGNIERAREGFKTLIKEFPDLKTPFLYLSLIYIYEKKYLNAHEILSFLERVDSQNKNLLIIKSIVLYLMEKYEKSIETLQKGIKLYPENWRFELLMAENYYAMGDFQNAIVWYERVAHKVEHFRTLFKLGILYLREGMNEKAFEYWSRALKIDPENRLLKRNMELLKKGIYGRG